MTAKEIADKIIESGCELEEVNDNWLRLKNPDKLDSDILTEYVINKHKVHEILLEDHHNAKNYE